LFYCFHRHHYHHHHHNHHHYHNHSHSAILNFIKTRKAVFRVKNADRKAGGRTDGRAETNNPLWYHIMHIIQKCTTSNKFPFRIFHFFFLSSSTHTHTNIYTLFYPMVFDIRKSIDFWQVPRPRPFVLLTRRTCKWRRA
jgi:hypothetical protein